MKKSFLMSTILLLALLLCACSQSTPAPSSAPAVETPAPASTAAPVVTPSPEPSPTEKPVSDEVQAMQDKNKEVWREMHNRPYMEGRLLIPSGKISYVLPFATQTKEVNLISWNGKEPKIDVRTWSPDHSKSAKIGTLSKDAARKLGQILVRVTE